MFTLRDIAETLGRPLEGDGSRHLRRAAEPAAAGPDDLALAMSPAYGAALKAGAARVAILWEGADWREMGLEGAVTVPRARLAMAGITRALDPGPELAAGIHPSAVVDPTAEVGADVAIGPLAVIGPRARIGAGTRLMAHVSVGAEAILGADCLLHPGVRIGSRVTLGDRVICQPGASIGGDGFSFVTPEESRVEKARRTLGAVDEVTPQGWTRIHSLGAVTIGDDVEIGANATIDKGTVADTRVGRGTKIDNLVMIGHNNVIGEDCLLCAQVGLAGGSRIGHRVVLAGQVGVNDNISIGDDVVAGGASKIFTRVPSGSVILGHPAVKMETQLQIQKAMRRLPRLSGQLAELRETVARLVQGTDHDRSED
ncbi:UDP-3-O-(3-hydroxymyristoyl)glucosamine N-acyltransferase [Jannaschia formosa]|uniref:UDP-3-O-(3-hydroxymyristoyl)glucosamine N-acyltransferase n=1 Tax=Jannaschia formosa TaxID=2259592 RepID=UPI000E1B901B|nr:UDP-3-O-(3-hydroxymyristoyl)glucosamine N-acyltransferase [Jannaschia formosa]TFL18187.1 UDP-3-O-(3-hydroxymyristoyl)glucosamine N-acyltransferase [Jannaschia formosa]